MRPVAIARRSLVAHALLALAAALMVGALLAPLAGARVVEGEEAQVGLQERSTTLGTAGNPASFDNPTGHPVLPSSNVYAIYWDPAYYYHGDWQHLIDGFLHNMAAEKGSLATVFGVDDQYTDAAGQHASYSPSFKGAYTDTHPYPTSENCTDPAPLGEGDAVACLTDTQLHAELQVFIKEHKLPTGMGTVYYLLTPPGVTACLGEGGLEGECSDYSGPAETSNPSYRSSFCSYHSYIGSKSELPDGGPNTVLYAVIPWSAGGLGDYHLAPTNRTSGYECQAGGYGPNEKQVWEKEKSPTQQEPNQIGRGTDGSYDAGLADLIVNQVAVEQQDIVTDPLLNAWQEPATGAEAVDECRDDFGLTLGGEAKPKEFTEAGTLYNQTLSGGNYYLNDAFDLAALKQGYPGIACIPGAALEPQFTVPTPVNAGEIVGFDGSESNVILDAGQGYTAKGTPFQTYPTYHWSFGDGTEFSTSTPGHPASIDEPAAYHAYTYGGTYDVTLTITDTGGNTASVTNRITVAGPPPPSPPASSSSSPASSATSVASSGSGGKGTSGKHRSANSRPLPRPVATAIVASDSLTAALSGGLPVRYSVNQQVAGHFEVMMPTRLARRLHISGAAARELPKGAPKQTVIGYALLVTMRKAHGTIRIQIPKQTGRKLARLHELTLVVRLVVRNASRQKPKMTLLQTAVKLRR